eukprot:RCo014836
MELPVAPPPSAVSAAALREELAELNTQLPLYGLPELEELPEGAAGVGLVSGSVFRCLRAALLQRQQETAMRSEAFDTLRRCRAESEVLQKKLRKSEEALARAQREAAGAQQKCQAMEQDHRRQRERHGQELAEA